LFFSYHKSKSIFPYGLPDNNGKGSCGCRTYEKPYGEKNKIAHQETVKAYLEQGLGWIHGCLLKDTTRFLEGNTLMPNRKHVKRF
jgi:hypothetical protein